MNDGFLFLLIVAFFLTSMLGVVTGSNSLITVPVMFQVGIDEKVAVATNMFGLVFMAIGGAIPFIRKGQVEKKGLLPLIAITIVGSAIGAAIVGTISGGALKTIVTVAMFAIVIFTLVGSRKTNGEMSGRPRFQKLGLILAFLLAIYGGLYSGGYVTVLTATCVAFLGMTYSGAIAATKVINVFSSGIAALVFMYQGLVDYRLGVILGLTMFVAAYIGAHFATRMNEIWLRRIFLATVLVLAVKTAADLLLA
jgi:uncharacterized membrane protein YfcA